MAHLVRPVKTYLALLYDRRGKTLTAVPADQRTLRRDLAAAGVPYKVETPDGPRFADFHALRHSFVTALAAAGTGPKVLQDLARHSTARLTLERYTHTTDGQKATAVARLALPGDEDTRGPFADLSRENLERVAEFLLVAALGLLPGCTPGCHGNGTAGDESGPVGTEPSQGAAA